MPPHRRFRAPTGNGDVLADPGFQAVPGLVKANRRRLDRDNVVIGGLPLRELRALARREVLALSQGYHSDLGENPGRSGPGFSVDAPLLLAGHQPELSHPGVWVKHFALNGLARKVGGVPLNLVVDNDTLKSTSLRFPIFTDRDPKSVHLQSVPFDRLDGETPYEDRTVLDPECFRTFADRAAPLWQNWGYEPLLKRAWAEVGAARRAARENRPARRAGPTMIGEAFTTIRRRTEREWGCDNLELSVSRLAQTEAFARFVGHVVADLPRFREVYNDAVSRYRRANGVRSANHPVPDLGRDEAPFWVWRANETDRNRLLVAAVQRGMWFHLSALDRMEMPPPANPGEWKRAWDALADLGYRIRPRALTLTLFARVCLGDFFIHGIGGGMYDEVTDAIIRDYFGVEPPAYQVLSATLHLPLPAFPSTAADVDRLERLARDLTWNPQRHLTPANAARPDVTELVREKAALAAAEPPYADHAARRGWFRRLHDVTEQLRPLVTGQVAAVEEEVAPARAEAHANAVLQRRDFAWVLYPEEVLRPFLQRFLDV